MLDELVKAFRKDKKTAEPEVKVKDNISGE
jgi:hypothetical protein